jgi:hypothetical protein
LFCREHRGSSLVTCHLSRLFYCPLRCSRKLHRVSSCKNGMVSSPSAIIRRKPDGGKLLRCKDHPSLSRNSPL